jgi:uncharacterized protein (DUF1800 family)/fibronectin type 3 domain-containing protein
VAVLCTLVVSAPLGATTKPKATAVPPPPAPTAAPAGVVAAPSNGKVKLTWVAVAGASGYRVFRAANGQWGVDPVATTTSLTHTSYNLANGTTYSFAVAAYTKGGNGPLSQVVNAMPLAAPSGVTAASGDKQVTLNWNPSAGAASYTVYRKFGSEVAYSVLAAGVLAPPFVDTGLTNGTRYYYQLRAVAGDVQSELSYKVSAVPLPPPPASAPVVSAAAGNARVTLTWNALPDATSYKIYRSTTGVFDGPPIGSTSSTTYKNYSLENGTTYYYTVAGKNMGGEGPRAETVSATPVAAPPTPGNVEAVAGDKLVTLSFSPSQGADAYKIYRSTSSQKQGSVPVAVVTDPPFVDTTVVNGPTYFYKVAAYNAGGDSPRSTEVSASPTYPAPAVDAESLAAFRFLRHATWGPRPGDVAALRATGVDAFLNEQLAAPPSEYPDSLFNQPVEMTQEHFMHLALSGPDQLRQRVAWALHKIWVVSAIDVNSARAIVTYQRVLMNGAFGNYRDLMRNVTLNPAMGRYLNMLNNRSQASTGVPPNENYPRELMQLFTMGIPKLNLDGSIKRDGNGLEEKVYTEADVKELARIFTGWTFGDGNPLTVPTKLASENYRFPMEAVAKYHDVGAKTFLGHDFAANQTAQQDLDQALDVIFNHPNLGPFVGRQLILQLVTSNPSPGYVAAVAAAFNDNGAGVRGDLAAVVRAVLTHPEANASGPNTGKLSEPALFVVSQLRALNASVTDHPFMSDKAEEMGQKVFFPPSVFSYYSPGYRVRGTVGPAGPLGGPEFQILTSVTALVRVNFVASLLGGYFGSDVTFDYGPFTSRAADPAALVDYCAELLMGTRISPEMRSEIIAAVRVSPATSTRERARTALYLTLVAAQTQVDY